MKKRILIISIIAAVLVVIGAASFFVTPWGSTSAKQPSAGNIKVGDYVNFGTYYDEPILWKCVDTDNGTMLISEYIICMKAYDAPESGQWGKTKGKSTKDLDRQQYGSKDWKTSNIREWLNSAADRVNFSTQPPVKAAILKEENSYVEEPGFLKNFTKAERSNIKAVSHDGCSDKVYLLSTDEVLKYLGGSLTDMDYARTTATMKQLTEKARINSDFKMNNNWSNDWWYYTRTPAMTNSNDMRIATFGGGFYYYDNHIFYGVYPGTGNGGILPALNLKSDNCKSGNGSKDNPWILKN